jgi:hypothetical protein
MVKIQVDLCKEANAIVSYEKARQGHTTKAETINFLLKELEGRLK